MGERHDAPALEAVLAAAVRADSLDPGAEDRARAAYRAARQTEAHGARTRRRDDWRPRAHRRLGRSLRATLAALLTSATLGGVAIASIGSVGTSDDDSGVPRPSKSAPDRTAEDPDATPGTPGHRDGFSGRPSARPPSARDREAGPSGRPVKKPSSPDPRTGDGPTTPNKPAEPGKPGKAAVPPKNPGGGPTPTKGTKN
ncbi:hypothetical protein [Streptomyces vastus]|uniref:Translation initiation factor IF-2 n=1 Tax=Streptomyces vastus TaxID=285451 RepID=A0ABP6DEL7_9ACTN